MRASRAWRDIVARIQAGYGHDTEKSITPGSLAIFCPACPQPGVNLPDDWKNDEREWVIAPIPHLLANTSLPVGYIPGAL